jgi:TolB protein
MRGRRFGFRRKAGEGRQPGLLQVLLLLPGLALAMPALAQLRIDITQGVEDAVPIAVVPFGGQGEGATTDLAAVIAADLQRSGRFAPLERRDMIPRPTSADEVRFEDWRLLKSDFLVIGRVAPESGQYAVDYQLFNVATAQSLLEERLLTNERGLRNAAHRIADRIYERLTGVRGAFATRIAYVAVDGDPPEQRYRMVVADADGYGARTIAQSTLPLMSPAWSPDARSLAYVSFEGGTAAVFVQELASGARRRVSARAGVNGAPAWSPDGRSLALTLSRDGNLDIYVLDLATQALTRVTSDEAIDTEAEWAADGRTLYFTSDRAGRPQIYRVALDDARRAERVTFTGNYNARPRLSPDGRSLALVTLDRGGYRIGVFDLQNRALRVLTNAREDESPSFAPNGATLIYATQDGRRGTLATASSDGRFQQRLSADQGDLREPAWSPYPPR